MLFRRVHGRYAHTSMLAGSARDTCGRNRFFSCPLSSRHLWTALRYVERNPLRAGLAPQPGEYEWSSAPAHLTGQDPSGVLDLEFWEREGGRVSGFGFRGQATQPLNSSVPLLPRLFPGDCASASARAGPSTAPKPSTKSASPQGRPVRVASRSRSLTAPCG